LKKYPQGQALAKRPELSRIKQRSTTSGFSAHRIILPCCTRPRGDRRSQQNDKRRPFAGRQSEARRYLNEMSDATSRLIAVSVTSLSHSSFLPLRYSPSLFSVNVPVKTFCPTANITCFRLRNAPMGFNTRVQPIFNGDAPLQPLGKSKSAVTGAHRPTTSPLNYRHGLWITLAVFGLLAVYAVF
jgi:hypothetical protein